MHFAFAEDQQTIKLTARELLASPSGMEAVRGAAEAGRYDDALWRELAELGWPGIAVAEEHGGQGLGAVELAILLEEAGYAVAATPLLSTALAADVAGAEALTAGTSWSYELMRARGNSIEGGTTEILKNIVAERVLGLPKLR